MQPLGIIVSLVQTSGGALIVKSVDSRGCTKGILIVPGGYKIYIRYGYYLFSFVNIFNILFIYS